MAFAEVMELITGTEKQHQEVGVEEEDEQVVGLERKTSSFAHAKRPDSADSSTITTTNTSSSSSFSGDGERVTMESLEVHVSAEKENGFHGEHEDVNNGNVYLDVDQGSDTSDAESDDHESQTVDHLNGKKKVTEFEKGSSSEENKVSREIDEVQDGDIAEEVEVIEEEEVDIEDVKDYKAKELLENQKTPDLLCPKCKNCITKVVVLKKRKTKLRGFRVPRHKPIDPPALPSGDSSPPPDDEKIVIPVSFLYKCLSCFTIFERKEKNAVVGSNPVPPVNAQQKPPQESTGCSDWIFSLVEKNEPLEDKDEAVPSVDANPPPDNHTPLVDTPAFTDAPRLTPMPPSLPLSNPVTIGPDGSTLDIPPDLEQTLLIPVVKRPKPEILKSIVYGGLTEAITSLGVISSAAGSGASTLNILVLGLANLFSGLILIIHNLQELRKEEPIRETTQNSQTNGEDESQYKRLLGRREDFMLHATIAILSFIVTGLLPPVVYYFSFRESHNKDYKVASVFGASLICITFLALAKAHVRNPTTGGYLKSVLYYATNAVSVSGITYVVGNVANQLLEKYGWSDGSETPAGDMMLSLMGRKAGGFGYSSSY